MRRSAPMLGHQSARWARLQRAREERLGENSESLRTLATAAAVRSCGGGRSCWLLLLLARRRQQRRASERAVERRARRRRKSCSCRRRCRLQRRRAIHRSLLVRPLKRCARRRRHNATYDFSPSALHCHHKRAAGCGDDDDDANATARLVYCYYFLSEAPLPIQLLDSPPYSLSLNYVSYSYFIAKS